MQMWKFFVLATRGSLDDTVLMKNILTLGVTLAILAGFIFVSFAAQKNNEQKSDVLKVLIIDGQEVTTPINVPTLHATYQLLKANSLSLLSRPVRLVSYNNSG